MVDTDRASHLTEDLCLGALTFQTIIGPALQATRSQLSAEGSPLDSATRRSVEEALQNCDRESTGFLHEFVKNVAGQADLEQNIQETYLRLHATSPTDDLDLPGDYLEFRQLSERAINLRRVLARVPDEMSDRKMFLETIKEIASSIKLLLDAVNAVHAVFPIYLFYVQSSFKQISIYVIYRHFNREVRMSMLVDKLKID